MTKVNNIEITTTFGVATCNVEFVTTSDIPRMFITRNVDRQEQYRIFVDALFKDMREPMPISFAPKKVIFNPPATIVFWQDGTKTVVKAQGKEKFDREKGLAMAIVKKVLGNKGNYNNLFKEWCR